MPEKSILWSDLFDSENEPSVSQIKEFVEAPLWDDLDNFLQKTYAVKPKLSYSSCNMDKGFWKGWNVKYKKSGKALCTLYPKNGYFMALVPVGAKEITEADLLIPTCCEYMQNLYNSAKGGAAFRSLAIEVTKVEILNDMKKLIGLRVPRKL